MLGLTYAEFDNIVGPKLEYAYPPDVLSKETFETLSDYAIVGSHLCKKIIVVKTEDIQFISYSVAINQPKYFRNTLLFSCGIVLERDADIVPYEPLLRKLSLALVELEMEQEFLFKKVNKEERLPKLLAEIFEKCQTNGEALVEIDSANYLAFKLFVPTRQPRQLWEDEVPMLLYDRQLTANLPWDIALQHILPKIDGIRYIKKIAKECEMSVDTVTKAVRTLLFYGCVLVTDVFRFNNVYKLAPDAARRLLNEPAILKEMEEFAYVLPHDNDDPDGLQAVIRSYARDLLSQGAHRHGLSRNVSFEFSATGASQSIEHAAASAAASAAVEPERKQMHELPSRIPGILRFLLRLRPDRTVAQAVFGEHYQYTGERLGHGPKRRQINLSNHLRNVDIRRLVAIAQEKRIIQRLYEFPVRGGVGPDLSTVEGAAVESSEFEAADFMRAAGLHPSESSITGSTSYYPYGDIADDDYEDVLPLSSTHLPSHSESFSTLPHSRSRKSTSQDGTALTAMEKESSANKGNASRAGEKSAEALENSTDEVGGPSAANGTPNAGEDDYLFMEDESEAEESRAGSASGESDASDSEDSNSRSSSKSSSSSDGSRSADSSDYEDQVDDAERLHARREQMEKLISGLHGAHSLDAFCCTHEIPPSAVLDTTHMFVPCKAASNR